jgi:hypothetical protein
VGSLYDVQAVEQTPHSIPVRAGGRVLSQIAVLKIGEQPTVLAGLVIQLSVVSLFDSHIFFGA